MNAKFINENISTKISFKGKDCWVNTSDLEDNSKYKLLVYEDKDLKHILKNSSNKTVMIRKSDLEDKLKEYAGGAGGAGYAVYGGGWGRSFGNPSMGGRFGGRGFGFGGSSNLSGGPNIMYTYDVKPLNKTLEPKPSDEIHKELIQIGSLIKGKILGKGNDIMGKVISIVNDNDNNIQYYLVQDNKNNIKRKVDPTNIVKHEPYEDNLFNDNNTPLENIYDKLDVNENFYPRINEELSGSEVLSGFVGWLTTRKKPITMSSKDDAGEVAELVNQFIKTQKLSEPRDNWVEDLIPMKESINEKFFPLLKKIH